MSRSFTLLALGAALLAAPGSASALTPGNLVVNGDGESPVGSEWTAVQGLGLRSYAHSAIVPSVLIGGGTFDGGGFALLPRDAGVNPPDPSDPNVTVNEQRIVLGPEDVEAIDTGTVEARFSAYLGGRDTQGDRMGAVAEWRGANDQPLGPAQDLPEVTNVERGNVSGAVFRVDQQDVPVGARSVVVRLTGVRDVVPMHNGYVDNITLQLISIPRIEKAFAPGVASADTPFRLTYTVRNSGELGSKPAWSFSDVLPAGVRIAPVARATTDCPAARISTADGRISVGGGVAAGQETCTAGVDVVAAPGRHVTGPEQLEDVVGLRVGSFTDDVVTVEQAPPGPGPGGDPEPPSDGIPDELPPVEIPPFVPPPPPPPPPPPAPPLPVDPWLPPFVLPVLRASWDVSGSGAREEGDRVNLRLRVSNPTSVSASRVRACVRLPSALRAVTSEERTSRGRTATKRADREKKGERRAARRTSTDRRAARSRSTSRPCWTVDAIPGDGDWETTLRVRVVRSTGATARVRVGVTSPDTITRASATAKVRTVDPDDDANDEDSERRDAGERRR